MKLRNDVICSECSAYVTEAVEFGRLIICLDCLDRGIKMVLNYLDRKN